MAGQKTPILATDYNFIQAKASSVLGVGSGDTGYGQPVLSSPVVYQEKITAEQWNELRADILKAYWHRNGLGPVPPDSIFDSPLSNMVGHWLLNQTSGVTIVDSIDSINHNATTYNTLWGVMPIKLFRSVFYRGTGSSYSKVITTPTDILELTSRHGSSYTIEFWIHPVGPGQQLTYGGVILSKSSDYQIARMPDGRIIVASDWNTGTDLNLIGGWIGAASSGVLRSTAIAPLDTSTHVAVVVNNMDLKIYINGNEAYNYTNLNRAATIGSNELYFGNNSSLSHGFNGWISDIRIWNIARTAQQITDYYENNTHTVILGPVTSPPIPLITANVLSSPDNPNTPDVNEGEGGITEAVRLQFATIAEENRINRLVVPPDGISTPVIPQGIKEDLVPPQQKITAWNGDLVQTVVVTFSDTNASRYFFNTGSSIEFSATRSGGTSNTKNQMWSDMLSSMGTLKFSAHSNPTLSIGFYELTTVDQKIFEKKAPALSDYANNEYSIYAKANTDKTELTFTIHFNDVTGIVGSKDENVDGVLNSFVQIYRANGENVSVNKPSATTTNLTGGTAITTNYSVYPDKTLLNRGQTVTYYVEATNYGSGTLFWTIEGSIVGANFDPNLTQLSGSVDLVDNNNDDDLLVFTIDSDLFLTSDRTILLKIRSGSVTGPIVAEAAVVTVLSPRYEVSSVIKTSGITTSYAITGSEIYYTVTTQNFGSGTLYWRVQAGATQTFANSYGMSIFGSINIIADSGTFMIGIPPNLLPGADVNLTYDIRIGTASGTIVATAFPVTVKMPTYNITALPNTSVLEDGTASVQYNVTTTNYNTGTLYWSTDTNFVKFRDGKVNDPVSIVNNAASIIRPIAANFNDPTDEDMLLKLRFSSVAGTVIDTSEPITLLSPGFTITPNVTSVIRGGTVVYTVTTRNYNSGTLFWENTGTTNSINNFFANNLNSGSIAVVNGTATITMPLANNINITNNLTIILSLRYGSASGTVVATAATVTVLAPTYTITPDIQVAYAKSVITYTVSTQNFGSGTLQWVASSGDTTTFSQQYGLTTTGSINIVNNQGSFTRNMPAIITSGLDVSLVYELRFNSSTMATSSIVTLIKPTYQITSSPVTSVLEDGNGVIQYNITTTNFGSDTLYWETSTNSAKFSDAKTNSSILISNNSASFTRSIVANFNDPTDETMVFNLRGASAAGTILATSPSVSLLSPGFTITPNVTSVIRGSIITYTITTKNFANGTIYWRNTGTTSTTNGIFTDNLNSGMVAITNGSATFTRSIADNVNITSSLTIILSLRYGSATGTVVATASTVTLAGSTYSLAVSPTTVYQNSTATYTVTTTNFGAGSLYWSTASSNAALFTDNNFTGTVSIANNSGTFTRVIKDNLTPANNLAIDVDLRYGSTAGTILSTATTTLVRPGFNITPNITTVITGGTITYTVSLTNFGSGTLYWTTEGTVLASRFTDDALTGSVNIVNNSGTITRSIDSGLSLSSSETIILKLRTVNTTGTVVATAATVTLASPTYQASTNIVTAYTKSAITVTVTTQNIPNGFTLYWTTASGATTTFATTYNLPTSGSFNVTNNQATFTFTIPNMLPPGANIPLVFDIRISSNTGTVVTSSPTVTLVLPTFDIQPNLTSISETTSPTVIYTVNVGSIGGGSGTVYWTLSGTATADDFADGLTSGTLSIVNNTASLTRTLKIDNIEESSETIVMQLRINSISGTIVDTAPTVTILAPMYSIVPSTTTATRGTIINYSVNTYNFGSGTLYWSTAAGDTTSFATTYGLPKTGTISITNDQGSFTVTMPADLPTSPSINLIYELRRYSATGDLIATAPSVTLKFPTYSITPNKTSVIENGTDSVTYTVTLSNYGNGTLYWTTEGLPSNEFLDNKLDGSVTITNNTGSIVRALEEDVNEAYAESMILRLRLNSITGTIVASAASVSVLSPMYTITPNKTSVEEGSTVSFAITTQNVANGTILYWNTTQQGGTITAADFTDNILTGSVTVNNSTASIIRTPKADNLSSTWYAVTDDGVTAGTGNGTGSLGDRFGIWEGPIYTPGTHSGTVSINFPVTGTYTFNYASDDNSSWNLGNIVSNSTTITSLKVVTAAVTAGTYTLAWTVTNSGPMTTGPQNPGYFAMQILKPDGTELTNSRLFATNIGNEPGDKFAIELRKSLPSGLLYATSSTVEITEPQIEVVTSITNLYTSWGPDSQSGDHAITFDWTTSTGRTGHVSNDMHLSAIINQQGYDGSYANSLVGKPYGDPTVSAYLNAGSPEELRNGNYYWPGTNYRKVYR